MWYSSTNINFHSTFIGNDNISDRELKSFSLYCPKLKKINVIDCSNVSDVGLLAMSNKCINLQVKHAYSYITILRSRILNHCLFVVRQ